MPCGTDLVEVQGEPDGEFERRLYVYNYLIYDRFSRDVVTLVVLTGDSPARAPFRYEFGRWGFRHFFKFPAVKIMDYRDRVEELEKSANPFAVVALTHIRYREAFGDYEQRLFWKTSLVKSLYHNVTVKALCRNMVRLHVIESAASARRSATRRKVPYPVPPPAVL